MSVAYPGFQRGGCLSSRPLRKAGGGCCRFLSIDTKRGGGGGCAVGLWPNTGAYPECAGGGC